MAMAFRENAEDWHRCNDPQRAELARLKRPMQRELSQLKWVNKLARRGYVKRRSWAVVG